MTHLDREDNIDDATNMVRNLVAYLRTAIGDIEVVELLGEIRETVLASAKERTIG